MSAIEIVCSAPSHPSRVVATFTRTDDGRWVDGMHLSGRIHRVGKATTELVDDRPHDVTWDAEEQPSEARFSHNVGCPACGDAVRARGEFLDPILDRLLANNVGTLSLTGFRGLAGK